MTPEDTTDTTEDALYRPGKWLLVVGDDTEPLRIVRLNDNTPITTEK